METSRGFTLVEIIIVLCLVTVMGNVVVISIIPFYQNYQDEQFLQQFKQDLYYSQQRAISSGATTRFIIDPETNQYQIIQHHTPILIRAYPQHVDFQAVTLSLHQIAYLSNGNLSKAGTIKITMREKDYRLVFTLGKGRFYIERF